VCRGRDEWCTAAPCWSPSWHQLDTWLPYHVCTESTPPQAGCGPGRGRKLDLIRAAYFSDPGAHSPCLQHLQ
jgi:hypothetical protein